MADKLDRAIEDLRPSDDEAANLQGGVGRVAESPTQDSTPTSGVQGNKVTSGTTKKKPLR